MRTRRYFCWSLGLPIGVALAGMAIAGFRGVAGMMLISSPVYFPLAAWACHRIKRATQLDQIVGITIALPPLFAAALTVVFGAVYWSIAGPIVGFIAGVIGVVIGYAFVMLSWSLYFVLQKWNFVTAEFTWAPEKS